MDDYLLYHVNLNFSKVPRHPLVRGAIDGEKLALDFVAVTVYDEGNSKQKRRAQDVTAEYDPNLVLVAHQVFLIFYLAATR